MDIFYGHILWTYFMDIFYMKYMKNTTAHELTKQEKHPVYEDKSDSDTRTKVVIVRGTFI